MTPSLNQLLVLITITHLSFLSSAFAEDHKPTEKVIYELNDQLKEIGKQTQTIKNELSSIKENKQEIDKHSDNLKSLSTLQKAEQSGLSNTIKTIAPEGGDFEILADGTVKIIPKNTANTKALLDKAQSKVETKKPTTGKPQSPSQKEISKDSKRLLELLNQANKQGLATLLKKMGTEGGNFELIEGGIKIIPNNTKKTKALAKQALMASKLVKERKLTSLNLGSRIDSWGKVKAVAEAWLKTKKKTGLTVGKIRNIKWLYIVSIVTNKGTMDTQLVIRASDGKTVAYTQNTFEIFN